MVPWAIFYEWDPVSSERAGEAEQTGFRPRCDRASFRSTDVDEAIAENAIGEQLGLRQLLAAERLDGIAPKLGDSHSHAATGSLDIVAPLVLMIEPLVPVGDNLRRSDRESLRG